jgi:hypothetical protein
MAKAAKLQFWHLANAVEATATVQRLSTAGQGIDYGRIAAETGACLPVLYADCCTLVLASLT